MKAAIDITETRDGTHRMTIAGRFWLEFHDIAELIDFPAAIETAVHAHVQTIAPPRIIDGGLTDEAETT